MARAINNKIMAEQERFDNSASEEDVKRGTIDFVVMDIVRERVSGNTDQVEKEKNKLAQYAAKLECVETNNQESENEEEEQKKMPAKRPEGHNKKRAHILLTSEESDTIMTVHDILNDPETNHWIRKTLSKKEENSDKRDTPMHARDILNEDHTVGDRETWPPPLTQTQLTRQQCPPFQASQPGAFARAPGEGLERRDRVQGARYAAHGSFAIMPWNEEPYYVSSFPIGEGGVHGLAEALPVENEHVHDADAHPFDIDALRSRKSAQKRRFLLGLVLMLVLVCSFVAIALGLVLGNKNKTLENVEASPSLSPSAASSEAPSFAPTTSMANFLQSLPNSTSDNIFTAGTPQELAYTWLGKHLNITNLPLWRMRQLFALVTFYYAFEGPSWWGGGIKTGWLDYNKDECYWRSYGGLCDFKGKPGVDSLLGQGPCNNFGEFQSLRLNCLGLEGLAPSFPPEMEMLTALTSISLDNSTINASMAQLLSPSDFHRNIEHLSFSNNDFTGTIPSELGLMSKLTYLSLAYNSITGHISSQLGMFSSLTTLSIGENGLTGQIPSEIGMLTNLLGLGLKTNHLTGQVPSELGLLTKIEELGLSVNTLTGTVPTQLGLLTSLTNLGLGHNTLSGPLPTEMGLLKNLEIGVLQHNHLTGTVPCELFSLTKLSFLRLGTNIFSGPIPSQVGLLTNLQRLYLGSTKVSGTLPSEIGVMSSMALLELQDNNLSGPLPSELGLMTSMEGLVLEDNDFTGTLPMEWSWLQVEGSLKMLTIKNNSLSGVVPDELCLLKNWNPDMLLGLFFECADGLCGCCWCPCPWVLTNSSAADCSVAGVFDPRLDHPSWPGAFPATPNIITINRHTDDYPNETTWDWSVLNKYGFWDILDQHYASETNSLLSDQKHAHFNTSYRLRVFDSATDGTCCNFGYGWFTITNSTPSSNNGNGTVVWNLTGDAFNALLEVILWVDSAGKSQFVEMIVGAPHLYDPSTEDDAWPGIFPTPTNTSNVITLNIQTDNYPKDTSWEWKMQVQQGSWDILNSSGPLNVSGLFSYTLKVESDNIYGLRVLDSYGDGTCCDSNEKGWFTINNSTPSPDHDLGTVIWNASGDAFKKELNVYLSIDSAGNTQIVEKVE